MKAIRTKFHGPTNTRGARLIADDGDGNRISISYPHELNVDDAHRQAATALVDKMGWPGQLTPGWYGNECFWVFTS